MNLTVLAFGTRDMADDGIGIACDLRPATTTRA
jgi:hypothetical protein